jgi:hypothetical protein
MTTAPITIGRAEEITLSQLGYGPIPARVDTGAKTSSIWASNVHEADGVLSFVLFANGSDLHTGEIIRTQEYEQRAVANSSGIIDIRYAVKFSVILSGKRVRATFTLADRSKMVYPVLIGRNMLHGKFIVDVKLGKPLYSKEKLGIEAKKALVMQAAKQRKSS